jgi:UDP-N-acetylglucosamine 2-epimerase (non-hydrolysing)
MLKIGIVVGTRPEAIKLAPVILAAQQLNDVDIRLVATGQHADMCDSIFRLFGIAPHYRLDIMQPGQTLTQITGRVLERLDAIFSEWQPDWLVVQGDTTSAFAAALAAFYGRIQVAHVEAGLRSGDIRSPWPEEMNRMLISRLAELHFAPTAQNAEALRREQILPGNILVTGNTGIDALRILRSDLRDKPAVRGGAEHALALAGVPLGDRPLVLITAHRRESFGVALDSIMRAILRLALRFPGHDFIYPVHPNPVVQDSVERLLRGKADNILLVKPLDYLPFVALMIRATLLLTDSGGIQEEGPSLGKRVVVMREVTERQEGLSTPLVRLSGTDEELIEAHVSDAIESRWPETGTSADIYGDGHAAERIVKALMERGEIA